MGAKPTTIRRRRTAPGRSKRTTEAPMTDMAASPDDAALPDGAALPDLAEAPGAAVLEKRSDGPVSDRAVSDGAVSDGAVLKKRSDGAADAPLVAETVAEALRPYLKNFTEVLQVVMRVVEVTSESYSGKAPHPGHLERLEAVSPGSAKAIIDMAIREQRSRLRIGLLGSMYPYIDLLLGFALAALCFTYGFLLGMAGHEQAGGAMIAISALGAIGWFIMTRLAARKGERTQSAAGLAAQGGAD